MKLYTKTVCPKCLLVKAELNRAGIETAIINIDQNEAAKAELIHAGFLSVPVLQVENEWFKDVSDMLNYIESVTQ